MSARRITRIDAVIAEREHDWRLSWHAPTDDTIDDFPTAAEAYAEAMRRVRALADAGSSSVARLVWETTSRVGRLVAEAIKADAEDDR